MERLRPLAQRLRTACGALDVPVLEALCISDGRYWSYCCPDDRCCPPEGSPLALPGTTVMAAAAAYAGVQVRGSLRDMEARLMPWERAAAQEQERALDSAGAVLVSRILDVGGRAEVAGETLALARALMERLGAASAAGSAGTDSGDDGLIAPDEAAAVILGLQDRETRDRAAEWMEGPEAGTALRLWRSLARRCVGAYVEHAAAPLTLAGFGSPGPWATRRAPEWHSGSRCAPTPTTRSPNCCTRRATRAWIRKRCAAASAVSARCATAGATAPLRNTKSVERGDGPSHGPRVPRPHGASGRRRSGPRPVPLPGPDLP